MRFVGGFEALGRVQKRFTPRTCDVEHQPSALELTLKYALHARIAAQAIVRKPVNLHSFWSKNLPAHIRQGLSRGRRIDGVVAGSPMCHDDETGQQLQIGP